MIILRNYIVQSSIISKNMSMIICLLATLVITIVCTMRQWVFVVETYFCNKRSAVAVTVWRNSHKNSVYIHISRFMHNFSFHIIQYLNNNEHHLTQILFKTKQIKTSNVLIVICTYNMFVDKIVFLLYLSSKHRENVFASPCIT